jgi:cytochrome P450
VPHSTFRYTTGEVRLGGAVIPPYAQVIISLAAANRDPARYGDPDTFDVRRSDGGHLAFGHGIHHCLGAPLARIEGQLALKGFVERLPKAQLAVDQPEYKENVVLRGLASLPVEF